MQENGDMNRTPRFPDDPADYDLPPHTDCRIYKYTSQDLL